MILNRFENATIRNALLPESWKSPSSLEDLEFFLQKNWEQRSAFFEDGQITSKQQFLAFGAQGSIKTKNYIGTIVFRGEQLNIFPKVFRLDADDNDSDDLTQEQLIQNLIRWLEYCSKIDYPYISMVSDLNETNSLKQLFISLYLKYVSAAIDHGLYFKYVDEVDDFQCIKGKVNIVDYYTRKVPQMQQHKFRCEYSNFEFDNPLNRIIKYTCWCLQSEAGQKNQKAIRNILAHLSDVTLVRCNPLDCDRIRLSKMHRHYQIVLSMSKMFLLNKLGSYSMGSEDSFCFLFPMELLFEGFVGGFIHEAINPSKGKVHLQASDMNLIDDVIYDGVSLGAAFNMRHDILIETTDQIYILDTKYKQLPRFEGDYEAVRKTVAEEPKQTDIYQVCEYARKRSINDVYLLYPMYRCEDIEPSFPIGISKDKFGHNEIRIHFVRIPFVFDSEKDDVLHDQLRNIIYQILS